MAERTALNFVCAQCETPFTARRRDAVCCSKACTQKLRAAERRAAQEARDCQYCGSRFTPPRSDSYYCQPACSSRAHYAPRERWHEKACEQCGCTYRAKRSDARFCGVRCSGQARVGKAASRVCEDCGVDISTRHGNAVTCSACADVRLEVDARVRSPLRNAIRRGLIVSSQVEPVSREDVANRDGWMCQLCFTPVLRSIKWPDPFSPSLDHVIPVSKGGPHVLSNLQLAHLLCNMRKGNRMTA